MMVNNNNVVILHSTRLSCFVVSTDIPTYLEHYITVEVSVHDYGAGGVIL